MKNIFFIAIAIVLLTSCSSVKKSQSSYQIKGDSIGMKKTEHEETKNEDSSVVKTEKEKEVTDITIEYGVHSCCQSEGCINQNDYRDDTSSVKPGKTITIKIDGGKKIEVDLGNSKPKNIHITHTGEKEKTDSSGNKTITAVKDNKTDSSHVVKNESSSSSSKTKVKLLAMLGLGIGVAIVFWIIWYIRKKRRQAMQV